MSLRKQAKILGISPAHLSRMVNGIRPWNPGLKARYQELTGNTFGNIRPVDKAEMVGFAPVNGRVGHDIAEVTSSTLVPPTTFTPTGTTQALGKYLMSLRNRGLSQSYYEAFIGIYGGGDGYRDEMFSSYNYVF